MRWGLSGRGVGVVRWGLSGRCGCGEMGLRDRWVW